MEHLLSNVGFSNLYTMSITSKTDKRQTIPDKYTIPDEQTRLLRAQLILEEALETINALGFSVNILPDYAKFELRPVSMESAVFKPEGVPNLEKIIDGCADTIYVSVGTMMTCGAPDASHTQIVCNANDDKFPGGKAVTNENGKFQKPEGWTPPNHKKLMSEHPNLMGRVKEYMFSTYDSFKKAMFDESGEQQ